MLHRSCAPGIIKASAAAAIVPTLTQIGTDLTTANTSIATDFPFTSSGGDLLFAVGIRNNAASTTLPSATWNAVACTMQSGVLITAAGSGGVAIYTISGGSTGARNFTLTPASSIGRFTVAAYDIGSWDGTIDIFTAATETGSDVDVAMTLATIAANARAFGVAALPLGNAAPLNWTGLTELDEVVQGTTAGVAMSTGYRVTTGAESSVTITCTGDTVITNKAIAAVALRNA